MIRENYHTHTVLCDGSNTPEEMVEEALKKGFTRLGFSGHMDTDIHMDIDVYYQTIEALKEKYRDRIDILTGIELDTLYDPSCAYGAEYIIGSTHYLDLPTERSASVDGPEERLVEIAGEWFGGDYMKLARSYYELEASVYDRTHCTFVGHFDLVTRFNDSLHFLDESDPKYIGYALEAMEHLVNQGLPFEINCGAYNRGRKKDFYPNHFLLKKLHEMGGEIFINSDAHQKELLDGGFEDAVKAAVSCGFTHRNILAHDEFGKVVMKQMPLDI